LRLSGRENEAGLFYEMAGDMASDVKQHGEAVRLYASALGVSGARAPGDRIPILFKFASAHYAHESWADASRAYEELLSLLPRDSSMRIECHKLLGKVFLRLGENAKALGQFDASLSYPLAETDRFEIQQEIVGLKIAEGKYDDAIAVSRMQIAYAARCGNKESLGLAETDLGIAYFHKGDYRKTLESFSTALEAYESSRNLARTTDALSNLGNVYSAMNDFHNALSHWEKALALSREHGTLPQQARILNNLGIAHYQLCEFQAAKSYYTSAMEIFGKLNSRGGVAMLLANLGEICLAEGEYEIAEAHWTRALEAYREMQDPAGIIQLLLQLCRVRLMFGDTRGAESLLGEALANVAEHAVEMYRPFAEYLEGMLYASSGMPEEAMNAWARAGRSFHDQDAFTGGTESREEKILEIRLRRAEVLLKEGRFEECAGDLKRLAAECGQRYSAILLAEIDYTLGLLARVCPPLCEDKPLTCFLRGYEKIRNERIVEVSWKLTFALNEEYARRGKREKAAENRAKTAAILGYFAAKFHSAGLRRMYLQTDGRRRALDQCGSTMESD
jgi:tetratricopeptide (TPR) repeat protein